MHHPMLRHVRDIDGRWDYPDIQNNSVLTNTYITYRTPASKYKMEHENQSSSMDMVHKYDKNKEIEKEVYKYIQEYVLKEAQNELTNKDVSPIHIIMILMGCYGDRWNDLELQDLLKQEFMNLLEDENQYFLTNFMLQALDSFNGVVSNTHDRSTCNCLRDFVVPFELSLSEDASHDCDILQHDRYSLKNLGDYATSTSHLDNTIINEIAEFEKLPGVKNVLSAKLFTDASVTNSTLKNIPKLKHLMTFVEYYCKYPVQDPYWVVLSCTDTETTLGQALSVMKG
jgi:hypothetical protein